MKTISLLTTTIIVITMILSCTKKETPTPQETILPTTIKKIQTITTNLGLVTTFEYNSDGKISRKHDNTSDEIYTYSGNTITITTHGGGTPGITYSEVTTLNAKGYISKLTGNDGSQNYETVYEYDNDGYCTKVMDNLNSTFTNAFTYSNGNRTSFILSSGPVTNTSEYYVDKTNTVGNEYKGMIFYGKSNKNLIKKETTTYGGSHPYTSTFEYEYEFDKDNYVTKEIINKTIWNTYTYK